MSGSDIMSLFNANSDSVEISIAFIVFVCCLCFCCTALLFVIRVHFQRQRAEYRRVTRRDPADRFPHLRAPETLRTTTCALPPRTVTERKSGPLHRIYGMEEVNGYLSPFQTNAVHTLSTRSVPDYFPYFNVPINLETNMKPLFRGHRTGLTGACTVFNQHRGGPSPSLQQSLHQTSTAPGGGKVFGFPVPAPIEVDGSVFGSNTVPIRTARPNAEIANEDSNLSDVSESSNQMREVSLYGNRSESKNDDHDSCGESESSKQDGGSQQMVSRTRTVHLEDAKYLD